MRSNKHSDPAARDSADWAAKWRCIIRPERIACISRRSADRRTDVLTIQTQQLLRIPAPERADVARRFRIVNRTALPAPRFADQLPFPAMIKDTNVAFRFTRECRYVLRAEVQPRHQQKDESLFGGQTFNKQFHARHQFFIVDRFTSIGYLFNIFSYDLFNRYFSMRVDPRVSCDPEQPGFRNRPQGPCFPRSESLHH